MLKNGPIKRQKKSSFLLLGSLVRLLRQATAQCVQAINCVQPIEPVQLNRSHLLCQLIRITLLAQSHVDGRFRRNVPARQILRPRTMMPDESTRARFTLLGSLLAATQKALGNGRDCGTHDRWRGYDSYYNHTRFLPTHDFLCFRYVTNQMSINFEDQTHGRIASLHYHTRTNPGLVHTTHAQQPLQTVDLENRRRRRHHVVHGRRTISLLQGLEKPTC